MFPDPEPPTKPSSTLTPSPRIPEIVDPWRSYGLHLLKSAPRTAVNRPWSAFLRLRGPSFSPLRRKGARQPLVAVRESQLGDEARNGPRVIEVKARRFCTSQ